MLPKKNRYPFSKGLPKNSLHGSLFTLRYQTNNSIDSRVAIVISKKVSPLATVRNKTKRRLLKEVGSALPKGFDLVFLVKKAIVDTDQKSLENEIKNILNKLYGNR
jgi:ribonuclease P protein component